MSPRIYTYLKYVLSSGAYNEHYICLELQENILCMAFSGQCSFSETK